MWLPLIRLRSRASNAAQQAQLHGLCAGMQAGIWTVAWNPVWCSSCCSPQPLWLWLITEPSPELNSLAGTWVLLCHLLLDSKAFECPLVSSPGIAEGLLSGHLLAFLQGTVSTGVYCTPFVLAPGIILVSTTGLSLVPFSELPWDRFPLEQYSNPAFLLVQCGPIPFWTCRRPLILEFSPALTLAGSCTSYEQLLYHGCTMPDSWMCGAGRAGHRK